MVGHLVKNDFRMTFLTITQTQILLLLDELQMALASLFCRFITYLSLVTDSVMSQISDLSETRVRNPIDDFLN